MPDPETAAVRALPDEYRALTAPSADADLRWRPGAGEWCALEIVGHIRDAADIEHARVLRLMAEDRTQLDGYDERAMVEAAAYATADRAQLERDLADACERLAALLDGLTPEQWERPGRHPVRGDVTVRRRIRRYVEHAPEHFEQMRQALDAADTARDRGGHAR
jgi:hypothetical protein